MTVITGKPPNKCDECGPGHVQHADRKCRALIETARKDPEDGHDGYGWCPCGPDTSRLHVHGYDDYADGCPECLTEREVPA